MASEQEARDAIAACLRSIGQRAAPRAEYLHGLASRIKQGKLCLVPSDLIVAIAQMSMTTEVVIDAPADIEAEYSLARLTDTLEPYPEEGRCPRCGEYVRDRSACCREDSGDVLA